VEQAVKRAGDARMDGLGSRAGEVPVTGRAGCRGYSFILTRRIQRACVVFQEIHQLSLFFTSAML
jgi:hypothetical protein